MRPGSRPGARSRAYIGSGEPYHFTFSTSHSTDARSLNVTFLGSSGSGGRSNSLVAPCTHARVRVNLPPSNSTVIGTDMRNAPGTPACSTRQRTVHVLSVPCALVHAKRYFGTSVP